MCELNGSVPRGRRGWKKRKEGRREKRKEGGEGGQKWTLSCLGLEGLALNPHISHRIALVLVDLRPRFACHPFAV